MTTMNKIPTISKETISLLKEIEITAVTLFDNGYESSDVFDMLSTSYGEPLGVDVIRMVVNSANLLNSYD